MSTFSTRIPQFPGRKREAATNIVTPCNPVKKPKLNSAPSFSSITKRISPPAGIATKLGRFSVAANTRNFAKPLKNVENMPGVIPSRRATVAPSLSNKTKKIPAWDLKGKNEEIRRRNEKLQSDNESIRNRNMGLESEKERLGSEAALKSQALKEALAINSQLNKDLSVKITQLQDLGVVNSNLESKLNLKSQELIEKESDLHSTQAELLSHKSLVNELTSNASATQSQLNATKLLLSNATDEIEKLQNKVKLLEDINEKNDVKMREDESLRRKLHNTIQELKGNIRVFCRIRPLIADEVMHKALMSDIQIKNDAKTLEIGLAPNSTAKAQNQNRTNYEFTFDTIFSGNSTQDEVFVEISQLVQSVLDGFNVCIFAYGQTGSGKTFTMEGPATTTNFLAADDPSLGMIPRSVYQIFTTVSALKARGWNYKMEVSCIEIYNENIQDLLNDSRLGTNKCLIKKSADKGSDNVVSNVTNVPVSSEDEVYVLLQKARIKRSVAATKLNKHSSRSHYIFQMRISGHNEVSGDKCEGVLNLVDLAGSERVKDSGASGDRLSEAKNINKSLSNLGNVIMALSSQKTQHVPYRNSKLTHLLMNSLGGNSKTLMFVNINPLEDSFNETISSLRFATTVNNCNIGTAHRRIN